MSNKKRKKIKRGVGNPTWVRDTSKDQLMREIHQQWCRDNGYPARGKYGQRKANEA
tara:strand:+ start:150 stop:317 length:168 start_codon:yes stop_codon:yes gene_type:complete